MSTVPSLPVDAGSWRAPSWAHATVQDVMRAPAMSCPADTPLVTVARVMVTRHVHAVLVQAPDGDAGPRWRIVSDRCLAAAGASAEHLTAGEVAEQPREAAEPDWPLDRAAALMRDHEVSHLVVVDPHGTPVGMVSTLDLAGAIAWGRA